MKIKSILRPTSKVIITFFVLLFISYAGHSLNWVFSDPEITNAPKPFLYDFLSHLPASGLFQIINQILLAPFYPIYYVLVLFFGFVIGIELPMAIYWAAVTIYLYLLAVFILNGIPILIAKCASKKNVSKAAP